MTPLLVLVAALLIGSGLALAVEPSRAVWVGAAVIGPGLFIVASRLAWAGHARVAVAIAAAGGFLVGASRAQTASVRAWQPPGVDVAHLERLSAGDGVLFVEGVLRHDAAPTAFGALLDLEVDLVESLEARWPTRLGARLSVGGALTADALAAWTRGRRLRAPVSALRRPLPYRNFGVGDAERDLSRRRLRLFGSVKSAALVTWHPGVWWEERAAAVRAAVRRAVGRAARDETTSAVVIAILIGDRTGLTAEQERRLQQAGTYHVIAISGGNVALLLGAMAWLPRWRRAGVRAGTGALALVLLLFALCVDGGASVARASLVAALWLLARWWDLRTSALQATGGAAGVLVLHDPLALHDPGFALSFGATLALILLGLRLHAARARRSGRVEAQRWPWRAAAAVALVVVATLSVELMLLPIGARWFSLVTGVGLVANLGALPAMAVVQAAGMGLVVLEWCGAARAADVAAAIATLGVRVLVGSGDLVETLPALVRHVPPPSAGLLLAYYVSAGACLLASWPPAGGRERSRWGGRTPAALASGVVACGCLLHIVWGGQGRPIPAPWTWGVDRDVYTEPWSRDAWLVLTVCDVGQGDASVLQFPNGRTWLVDAGGAPGVSTFDVGARVTAPALWALGLRRLDRLVLTHADSDHAAGVPAVLERFGPRELVMGIEVPEDGVERAVREAARQRGVAVRWVHRGERLTEGGVSVRVLHPPAADWSRVKVRNDDSVTLWVRYGDVGLLLPGDAGTAVEPDWIAQVAAAPIVVWRAGHHGSRSSTGDALLRHLRPAVVISSSGRTNRFGHPHGDVLRRARAVGASLWGTDADGAVQVATNGRVVIVRSATGRRALVAGRATLRRRRRARARPA